MAGTSRGHSHWSLSEDDDGNREYMITFLVETAIGDGPLEALISSGIPAIGDFWAYGNDSDPWAFCTPYAKVTAANSDPGEQVQFWKVERKFSTIPIKRCQDISIDNPLLEPPKLSGSFVVKAKETTQDRTGTTVKTTSHDVITLEDEDVLPTVRVSQNVIALGLSTFSPMVTNVNSVNMWGLGPRTIKLTGASWEQNFYGVCTAYYTRTFDFEVKADGWDISDIPNRSKKVIRGAWNTLGTVYIPDFTASISNPNDFIRAKDKNGELMETWVDPTTGAPTNTENFLATVELADESNFFILGVPSVL